MGKNMYAKHVDDELDDINPSCMWGIIHAIDYHHWRNNVKRMLPHRRNPGRRAKSHASPKIRAPDYASGEMQMLLHEEERASPVNQSNKESASINKRSLRARFKAFIAEQTHKEGNDRHRVSGFSAQSGLERTYSIHHLEPSDHGLGEMCSDWEHPIIFFPGNEDTGGTKLQDPTKSSVTRKPHAGGEKFNKIKLQDPTKSSVTRKPHAGGEKFNKSSTINASKGKLKDPTDVLEMLKVNKDLFLQILKNADDGIKKMSRTSPASKAKSRLTKSGSFPAADLSQRRNLGPSKLKHKQGEIWSTPLGEKYPMDVLNYSKNLLSRSWPSTDNSKGTRLGRALSLILQSTIESDKEGPTDFVMPLKEKKHQEIQFEGLQGKNETNSSCLVLGEVSNREASSTEEKYFAESSAESAMNRDDIEYRNSPFYHGRSSSLNESMEKYASLFERNFGKEVNLQSSKSLRLSNENEMRSGKSAPFLFKRIRSLSQLDELYSSLQNVVQVGGIFADWPITSAEETSACIEGDTQYGELKPTGFSTSTEEYFAANDTQELQHQNETIERTDGILSVDNSAEFGENITDECSYRMEDLPEQLTFRGSSSYKDEETRFPESCSISASENFFQDEASREFQSTEGLESRCDLVNIDSSIKLPDGIDRASSTSFLSSIPNLENIAITDYMKAMEKNIPNNKDDTDLDYVNDLLERSAFTKNAFKWTWHSLDQPLSPSVFEEMEAYWHQELECSKEDLWSCYHHLLLFELVNEELARLYDRSYTYYPKALSSICRVRPFPEGNHLLEEIFNSINSLMSLKPEKMQSLDSVVDLDLKKNDGWMNLQLESEGLALELEDMIFDELLEELVCF